MPVEETTNEIRARIKEPSEFEQSTFRYKVLSESQGISAIIGKLKSSGKYEIQAYRFKKEKGWTISKVKVWLSNHKLEAKSIEDDSLSSNVILKSLTEFNKSVISFVSEPKADENMAWDGGGARNRIKEWASNKDGDVDFIKFKKGFAWVKNGAEDNLTAYKLPHHDIIDGGLKTVWKGVASAMAALLGSRGGIDIPADSKRGIYNHLAKHYKEFDKPIPDFK